MSQGKWIRIPTDTLAEMYLRGMTTEEIASQTGMDPKAVKNRLFLAKMNPENWRMKVRLKLEQKRRRRNIRHEVSPVRLTGSWSLRHCKECGVEFAHHPTSRKKYCSVECRRVGFKRLVLATWEKKKSANV